MQKSQVIFSSFRIYSKVYKTLRRPRSAFVDFSGARRPWMLYTDLHNYSLLCVYARTIPIISSKNAKKGCAKTSAP